MKVFEKKVCLFLFAPNRVKSPSFFREIISFSPQHFRVSGQSGQQNHCFSPWLLQVLDKKQCFRIFFSSAAPNFKMSFERHYFTVSSWIGRFWRFPGCSCIVCFFLQFLCYIIISLSCLSLKNRYPREPSSPWFP